MNTIKKCILLGILILNLIPYMQDGKVMWMTMEAGAQDYTIELRVGPDNSNLCVHKSNPSLNFYTSFSTCTQGEACSCERCDKPLDKCGAACKTQIRCDCLQNYTCGGTCQNPNCGHYNDEVCYEDDKLVCQEDLDYDTNSSIPYPSLTNKPASSTYPTNHAPIANILFKSKNLTEYQWSMLELMLDIMRDNCMGSSLYSGVRSNLSPNKYEFELGNKNQFYQTSENMAIMLDNKAFSSGTLFHEMFHGYQKSSETTVSYNSSALNKEIEAFYAKYLYLSQMKESSEWSKSELNSPINKAMSGLKKYIDKNGDILDRTGANKYISEDVISALRSNGYTEEKYKFDSSRSLEQNFSHIKTLNLNCI